MSMQEALKLLRLELGMTQADLARKMNKAFITVNRWENGKGFPSRTNAKAILDIAKSSGASEDCITYLGEVLLPDLKRSGSAANYGFPDIDKELLFQLADGSNNILYVIDAETHRLIYANRMAQRHAVRCWQEQGISADESILTKQSDKECYAYFGHRKAPCAFCPLGQFDDKGYKDAEITVPETGHRLLIHAKVAKVKGRRVYIMYLTDITKENTDRKALYELTNDIPVPAGIYHVYMDGRIELAFMNNLLFEIIGEERGKEIKRGEIYSICLIHPEDRGKVMDEIKSAIAEKRNVSCQLRIRVSENTYQAFHINARLIKKGKERLTFYSLFQALTPDTNATEE